MRSLLLNLILMSSICTVSCAQTKVIQQNTETSTDQNKMSDIYYIGHRGESSTAPENTLSSFRLAWQLNADGAECDIHLSKDNRVMIMHDANTKRTSGVDMEIKNTNSDDLRKLDVGVFKDSTYLNEKMPFLEEAISIVPEGKKFVIEIKCGTEVFPFLKAIVDESGKKAQLIFISFDWDVIVEAKKQFPENKCYWLSSKKETLADKMKECSEVGLDGLDLNYKVIDEEVMAKAKELNLDIITWTVDKPEEAKRLIGIGVKGFTTNRTAWLKSQVNN